MAGPAGPTEILAGSVRRATDDLSTPLVGDAELVNQIGYVARNSTGAGVRLLLACALAKVVNPNVDIRKPYTELGGTDSFSGRTYDERYITALINEHKLPANSTTAFLSPALRTKNPVLVRGINL